MGVECAAAGDNQLEIMLVGHTYLWNATSAFALRTDSFLCRGSQAGSDQRKRPSRSMLPDCWSTSQTQATCSWVKPNEGNRAGDSELGIVGERPPVSDGWGVKSRPVTLPRPVKGGIAGVASVVICPTIITVTGEVSSDDPIEESQGDDDYVTKSGGRFKW